MSWGSGKSPGWAAFDLKNRKKQGLLEPHILEDDPFPPMPSSLAPPPHNSLTSNNSNNDKPFSSLFLPSLDNGKHTKNPKTLVGECSNKVAEQNDRVLAFEKPKELYRWADNSLLEDVLAAADDNVGMASTLLKGIFPNNDTLEQNGPTTIAETNSTSIDFPCHKTVSLGNTMSLAHLSSTFEDSRQYKSTEKLGDENIYFGKKLSDDNKLILEQFKSVPVEHEWEEDDFYLVHRKDALKMMRSASQHSRAATNAFLRGDHVSAQHHSMKAREEWLAGERLNAESAKEIFSIRNSKNNPWNLDLHGLHASEAIRALQERLQQIETQVQPNHSVSPNRVNMKDGTVCSSSLESFSCMDTEKLDIQQASSRRRPTSLQVITGIGNHSRGHAAIPTAVRSYLNDNRYHFDELRPGVVTVRPKFRHW